MKKLIILSIVLLSTITPNNAQLVKSVVSELDPRQSCTIIYASDSNTAFAGNNEDWTSPFGTIWFIPAEKGKNGRVYFGWKSHGRIIPQGGMNDQGLFWDGATAENIEVPHDSTKPRYYTNLIFKAMEECATVDDVIELFGRYDQGGSYNGHYLIGDRFGNSAIIEPLTVIRKTGKYQIITNFLQSKIKPENIKDTRYRLAENIFKQADGLSVNLFRKILNAAHWEEYSGSMTVTLYSYICDLKNGDIYVYHFHNFEDVVKINVQEELKKGEHLQSIISLFPYETFASKRYNAQRIIGLIQERAQENGLDGDEGALALFSEIKRGNYKDYNLSVVAEHLLAVGYEFLELEKTTEAIQTLKFAVSEYPQSATLYDALGEAYMIIGEKKLAKESYQKSLELNPDNENAKKKLEQLTGR